jgi:hypothetical protein
MVMANQNLLQWDQKAGNMLANIFSFANMVASSSKNVWTSKGEILEKIISSCNEPYRTSEKFFRKPPHEMKLCQRSS